LQWRLTDLVRPLLQQEHGASSMRKSLYALAAVAALGTSSAYAQDTGDWLVRVRATHLDSANKDDTGLGLSINDKWLPEFDVSYFFTPNIAAELVLTYPQKQTVSSTALGGDIGSFKHLPPTLLAQYHFTGLPGFRPYVGLGVNYTRISDVHLADGAATLKKNSWGLAGQVGVDVPVGGNWLLNVDVKKVQIGTKVYVGGDDMGKFKVDPWLVSLGVGYRF